MSVPGTKERAFQQARFSNAVEDTLHGRSNVYQQQTGQMADAQVRGFLKTDSKFFISLAHDEADIARTLDAIASSVDVLKTET